VLSSLTHSSAVGPSINPSSVNGTTTPSNLNPNTLLSAESNLFSIVDPEIVRKNPVEAKHRRLVRDHRNGPLDRELKPNAKIRDELNVSSPFCFSCPWPGYLGRSALCLIVPGLTRLLYPLTGYPSVSSDSRTLDASTRSSVEIPILPHSRQTCSHQVPQGCRMV